MYKIGIGTIIAIFLLMGAGPSALLHSQIMFNKLIGNPDSFQTYIRTIHPFEDGYIAFADRFDQYPPHYDRMSYIIFDEYGQELESEFIFESPYLNYAIGTNSCYEEEENFWLCYVINETEDFNSINNILLGKFNKSTKSFNHWVIGDTGVSEHYKTIFKNQDGNLVLVGTSTWNYGGDSIVNKLGVKILDTLGSLLESRYYMYENDICVGFYGEQLNNGDYLLSGWADGPNQGDLDMYYLRTDAAGTKLWEKRIGHPTENDGACRLYQYNEDTLLLKGIYFDHLYLAYLNYDGDILYEKYGGEFEFGQRNSIYSDLVFRNNSIFGLLHLVPTASKTERHLINLDHDFNIISLKNVSGELGEDNYFNDLKPTDDCGFITAGYVVYEDNTAQARIIKLSSDGDVCFPPDCVSYEEPEECIDTGIWAIENHLKLAVYPNPTTDYLYIAEFTDSDKFPLIKIEILDLSGRIIHQLEYENGRIDLRILRAGIYIMRAMDKKGNLYHTKLCKQ